MTNIKTNKRVTVSGYHSSIIKRTLDISLALMGLSILIPASVVLTPIIMANNWGPIFFLQKRRGINGKTFTIYKFRTMRVGSESERGKKYLEKQNISDGPVFKVYNDPRFTSIGKLLAITGLDELPQVINVLKGEMSIVGPRPFPLYEAEKLTKKQRIREKVLPGISSSWVIKGSHSLSFKNWMDLDGSYVKNANITTDLKIILDTIKMLLSVTSRKLRNIIYSWLG